jgi:SnoaL-like polyketide cyclase
MTTASENRAIALRWLSVFWGQSGGDPGIVDDLSAPDVVLQCATDEEYRGRQEVKNFRERFREAIPDFRVYAGAVTSERDVVILRWEGIGTHTGPSFEAMQIGPLPAASREQVICAGHSAITIEDGKVAGEAVWSRQRQAQMQMMLKNLAL